MAILDEHAADPLRRNRGDAWVDRLPDIITQLVDAWSIVLEPPFARLSFSYVAPARLADGRQAVFKVRPPDDEFEHEVAALTAYAGRGAARIYAADVGRGALLLERVEPGAPVHTIRDDPAEIAIAASIMRQLWQAPIGTYPFPTVADWGKAFDRHRAYYGGPGPLPAAIFARGEALYRELDASATEWVLLHGDLHQDNILRAERAPWLAIDPHGVVGDPCFEVGPLLNNLWEELYPVADPQRVLRRRVDLLAGALGFDRERVRAWGIAFCVLSAVWSAEEGGGGWEDAIAHAEILAGDE